MKGGCMATKCTGPIFREHYCEGHYEQARSRWNSLVYFIRAGAYVKIGYSKNPHKRLREIPSTVGWPEDLTHAEVANGRVVATEPGGAVREARLHAVFREYRVSSEWFEYSGEIDSYIQELLSDPDRQARQFDRDPVFDDEHMVQLLRDAKTAHERFMEVKRCRWTDPVKRTRERERAHALFAARSEGVSISHLAGFLGLNKQYIQQITHPGEGDEWLGRWIHTNEPRHAQRIYAMSKQ